MVFLSVSFICMLGNKRRIQHYIKSRLGPYFMRPLTSVSFRLHCWKDSQINVLSLISDAVAEYYVLKLSISVKYFVILVRASQW